MRPLLVSCSDISGGAARATWRLHRALVAQGIASHLYVAAKQSDDWRTQGPAGKAGRLLARMRPYAGSATMRLQRTENPTLHSPALLPSQMRARLSAGAADVVNLHWVCGEMVSVEDIGRITKPVVWTLHDMWAFCGAEHYAQDGDGVRWRQGYEKDNRGPGHGGLDIDRWVWRRKRKAWKRPFHIVTPSRWLADCARGSALMHDWPVTVMPNALDTNTFKPLPKNLAREILGLPQEPRLVLFGAIGGGRDPRKGWDLLQPALTQVAGRVPNVHGVIFGQGEPQHPLQLGLPLHWMGHLHDDTTIALLYSAADVMVVPSRQEAFGQTASEAQACGCPVVAFNVTGLPDVVEHGTTGYLAESYSSEDLAKGIAWVLEDTERHAQLGAQARARAVRLWSPEVVVPQYLEVYQAAIDRQG